MKSFQTQSVRRTDPSAAGLPRIRGFARQLMVQHAATNGSGGRFDSNRAQAYARKRFPGDEMALGYAHAAVAAPDPP